MESFVDMFNLVKKYCLEVDKITDVAYNVWIKPIEPVNFDNNIATLFVKSEFQKNIIIDKYLNLLNEAFNNILGFSIDINIVTKFKDQSFIDNLENDLEKMDSKESNKELHNKNKINENKNIELIKNSSYEYTFDTFIVGSSNNFAYAACKAISQNQTGNYNPLFIYGPSGLGKTHLLCAIRNELLSSNPDINIIYVTGESFTNELINSFVTETTREFHSKYRKSDILLVDDIQFIAGKERTQEEFFYTFNELYQLGKQIVLTSDRPPKDIKTLENRLRTRFEWGLITDIYTPDIETRIAIIKRKAQLINIEIPNQVIEFIANKLKTNIRQLEGAVKKVKAYKLLAGSEPSISIAQNVIRDILNDDQPITVTVEIIITEISKTYGIKQDDIKSNKRSAPISIARQSAIYIVREITQMPLSSIGEEFGGRDHSTIVYAIQQVEKNMKKDKKYKETIEDIINNIRNK